MLFCSGPLRHPGVVVGAARHWREDVISHLHGRVYATSSNTTTTTNRLTSPALVHQPPFYITSATRTYSSIKKDHTIKQSYNMDIGKDQQKEVSLQSHRLFLGNILHDSVGN